jgi:transcriptional regulator with XRE-family HTH domain
MTQETLAEKASIDRRSLQRLEAGQWNMTVDYLDRLREALGCTWSQLIERL